MLMLGQHALAVGVEAFGDAADAVFLEIVGGGEWERVEAHIFVVARPVLKRPSVGKGPA